MQKKEVERYAFLYLCGENDREILTGKREMTFSDFERFIYLMECLGFLEAELEIWGKYGRLFENQYKEIDDQIQKAGQMQSLETSGFAVDEAVRKRTVWIEEFCRNSGCAEIRGWFADYL